MADHENLPAWTVGSRHPADRPKGPRPSARNTASLANFSAGRSTRAMRSPPSIATEV